MSFRARFAITSLYSGQTRATNVTRRASAAETSTVTVATFEARSLASPVGEPVRAGEPLRRA